MRSEPGRIVILRAHCSRRCGIVALAALCFAAAVWVAAQTNATARPTVPKDAVRIDVRSSAIGAAIPPGFVGLSIEYHSVPFYFGSGASALNPTFVRLVRYLDPVGSPLIRIGGDSTDWTWWPLAGFAKPGGIRYALTPRWLALTRAMATALRAHLILGVNFEADSGAVAAGEVRALLAGLGRRLITGFELGNEPEVYGSLRWYTTRAAVGVTGRGRGYDFRAYLRDYAAISRALPRGVPLVGPASGAAAWFARLSQYLRTNSKVRLVTLHRYPLRRCYTPRESRTYASIGNLVGSAASSEPALSVRPAVAAAHARGIALRVDELNSASCGGVRGVSNTFASSLWVLDTLFEMARVGVDGVNIHTFKNARYQPFAFRRLRGRWTAEVRPLYYGMWIFARAAPAGSRLLSTSPVSGRSLRVWATRDSRRTTRVVLINDSPTREVTAAVGVPNAAALATLERLTAPGLAATGGVRIGGQTFGASTATARLTGPSTARGIEAIQGRFVFGVPPASAALLSVSTP